MSRLPPIDRIVDFIDPIIDAIVERAAVRMSAAVSADPIGWYDQTSSPLPKRAYLAAARRGAFKSSKVGRRVFARRVDVDAFIASNVTRTAAETEGDRSGDDRRLLERAGVRLRRGT